MHHYHHYHRRTAHYFDQFEPKHSVIIVLLRIANYVMTFFDRADNVNLIFVLLCALKDFRTVTTSAAYQYKTAVKRENGCELCRESIGPELSPTGSVRERFRINSVATYTSEDRDAQ
jgi:hypothetical protein